MSSSVEKADATVAEKQRTKHRRRGSFPRISTDASRVTSNVNELPTRRGPRTVLHEHEVEDGLVDLGVDPGRHVGGGGVLEAWADLDARDAYVQHHGRLERRPAHQVRAVGRHQDTRGRDLQ